MLLESEEDGEHVETDYDDYEEYSKEATPKLDSDIFNEEQTPLDIGFF